MEPLNDQELDELLKQWPAPPAPETLVKRIRQAKRRPWWKWLIIGTIRVPVPLALALSGVFLAMFVFVALRDSAKDAIRQSPRSVFQPVKRLEPRIIRSSYEANN
jgi:hypothetical protein